MATAQNPEAVFPTPLRLWPGIAAVGIQWLLRFGVPVFFPEKTIVAVLGGLAGGLIVALWWLFFSRAPWLERLGGLAVLAAAMFAGSRVVDESIATGAQRMLFYILAVPVVSLAFVLWAVLSRRLSIPSRWAALAGLLLLASCSLALIRTGGFTGGFQNDIHWRWTKTPEERLLAQPADLPPPAPAAPPVKAEEKAPAPKLDSAPLPVKAPEVAEHAPEWPGFRGPNRDGVVPHTRIETDWTASPPVRLWSRPVGPGWSSFAVRRPFLYTQEQRGPEEIVSCYRLTTGEPVWTHRDTARFWESNGGPGPRGTPTLANGRAYTFGATGILNALNADTGAVAWSRNAAAETKTKTPDWGFASSPLLVGDAVIVAVSGQLAAYDSTTGNPRWVGPRGGTSYSSPVLATFSGVPQILLVNRGGLMSVDPAAGKELWQHAWQGYPIVQPAVAPGGDILFAVNEGSGTRRLAVAQGPSGWTAEERWTSNGLKPYFNDFVVHGGHAFGFDGSILSCIDLADGKRKWKGGRYGHGQLILLPDQDLLLILSEEGEVALVKATPDQFTELARIPAIEGKTWNHPVLVGDILLVRNGEVMAAFRLPGVRRS